MIETKTSLLKEKKQELDLLNKQYDKYIKNIISIISFNTVNNNYLYLTSYEEGGFKFTYSKDIVNFYAYYTKNNGFSIKARNSNEMLDFESFEILNNHYKDFYKLVSFFNEKKCIEVSTNITNFISEIVSLEDQIKTLSEEIEKNQEQYAFEEISFGLKLFSQQDIDETAAACANVACELEQLACEHSVEMRITMDTPPEFQPHLMAAINQVKASSWNVSTCDKPTPSVSAPGGE